MAIKRLKKGIKKCKLKILVVRVNSTGTLMDSKPCCFCFNYIKSMGIKKIYYSNSEGKITKATDDNIYVKSAGMRNVNSTELRVIVITSIKSDKKTVFTIIKCLEKSA